MTKKHYDIFNGDADGICALVQLRLATPIDSVLITGVKRDIALVEKVDISDCNSATVLDISFDKNREAVAALIEAEIPLEYFDHHKPGAKLTSPLIDYHIDTEPTTCTGLLVSQHIQHAYPAWACVALYGDNQHIAANTFATQHNLAESQQNTLRELGTLMNYNGYGNAIEDLHIHPKNLFQAALKHIDPVDFYHTELIQNLRQGYQQDNQNCNQQTPHYSSKTGHIYILPNTAWARRMSGDFGNQLARKNPDQAHAVISEKPSGGYLVSVRAPKQRPLGADALCSNFPSGGGRSAAAGINHLDLDQLPHFIKAFDQQFTP